MRLLHVILCAVSAFLCAAPCVAQGRGASDLIFERNVWDFGVINEVDGPVSYTFRFTNGGKSPIVIERVTVSCGCTTPEYTRKPVMPGAAGEVKITFDPTDRPGTFIKDIHIISGKGKNNDKITIRGEVKGRPRSVEEDYPYELGGGLRLQRFDANFGYVEQGKPTMMMIGYANTSDRPVKLDYAVSPVSDNVTVSGLTTICAGCRGELTIIYDMRGSSTYGRVGHKVNLWVNGEKEALGITTTAIIVDRFAPGDTVSGPRMTLSPAFVDLEEVTGGTTAEVTLSLKNDGVSPLLIRAVQPRKNVDVDIAPGAEIAPGGEVKVKASLRVPDSKGKFFADGIYITTNDPVSPMREFRIMGKIK